MKLNIQDGRQPDGYRMVELNRRKAIAEKCLNCSGFEYKSRQNCEFTSCLLYKYRTGTGKQDSVARNRAIRAYCRDDCMEGSAHYVSQCTSPDCPLFAYRMVRVDRSIEVKQGQAEEQV